MKEVWDLLSSKYVDITIAVFMAIFAYTNYTNGKTGFVILFAVLSIANILTAYMKHVRIKQEMESEK